MKPSPELDDAAQHELVLTARERVHDLATHKPSGLAGHAELTRELSRRRRLRGRGQQPDGEQPLAQIGARAVQKRPCSERALVVAGCALIEAVAVEIPRFPMAATRTGEALRPAVFEERLPAVLLGGIHLHELDQCLRMPHHFRLLLAC